MNCIMYGIRYVRYWYVAVTLSLFVFIHLFTIFLSIYPSIYLSLLLSQSLIFLNYPSLWLCIFSPSLSLLSVSFAPPLPLYHSISLYLFISQKSLYIPHQLHMIVLYYTKCTNNTYDNTYYCTTAVRSFRLRPETCRIVILDQSLIACHATRRDI